MPTPTDRDTKTDSGNGHAPEHPLADFSRTASRLSAEITELGGSVRELAGGFQSVARDQLRRQPYVAIAIAAGVGYVLGGGLPRGIIRGLLTLGGRVMLESAVANLAASATSSEPRV
jgi:hypothetical protein